MDEERDVALQIYNAKIYHGKSKPTDPEVAALLAAFPPSTMHEGQILKYQDIESTIDEKKNSLRWLSIIPQWQKFLKNTHSFILKAVRNTGYKICNDSEKLHISKSKQKTATKYVKSSIEVALRINTNKLDPVERRELEHIQMVNTNLTLVSQGKRPIELPYLGRKSIEAI